VDAATMLVDVINNIMIATIIAIQVDLIVFIFMLFQRLVEKSLYNILPQCDIAIKLKQKMIEMGFKN
jgi:hypothetical protein